MPTPIKIEPATEAVSRKRPALEHGQVKLKRRLHGPRRSGRSPFIFHKDRLCQSSDFFVAACAREWQQGDEKIIRVPAIEPSTFELYTDWTYRHQIDLSLLYIAGDMLLDERVKNLVIDELVIRTGHWPHGSLCVEPEHVRHVWEHSAADSNIRAFLLTSFAATMNPTKIGLFEKEFYPSDFFYDLALRHMELRDSSPRDYIPNVAKRCRYHIHAGPSKFSQHSDCVKQTPGLLARLTGDERARQLRKTAGDRPLDRFTYGPHPISGNQTDTVKQVRIPTFSDPLDERAFRKLHAAACIRWLGLNGYNNEGAGGHITVRDPINSDQFWINPFCKSFKYMKPEDLCLVDEEGIVQPEGNMHAINPAGFAIHSAVHQARPDVIAAVHCHSLPTKAFSALGCKLEPINQDDCRFYEDHAVYENFGGIVLAHEEGRRIAKALGNKKAVILQNHGILTVAKSVDAATYLFGAMDRCIEAQLLADAAAGGRGTKTIKIDHEEAEYTRRVYTDEMEYNMFQSCFEDIVRESHGELSMLAGGERNGYDTLPRAW
ncbi:hypothetical protein B0A55_10888 [Friedmanniomyces simplex]|uniref:Class II aldolase/adducin N-terminal domain-containing protein n=1 Tax=Friedmanniomyces simplex TaxID=329884 RepID=A0A4U0WGY2_9PEZI|nr:hypothetical protein B0A55_10888 [Friedmanniomyces simplex]